MPESLSLLDQYEVKKIEELSIRTRWLKAEPNKSIRSLIGWRGKTSMSIGICMSGFMVHALVGGTTVQENRVFDHLFARFGD